MKIYLAGKWTDKETIRTHMDELEFNGHKITHDWTSYEADSNNAKSDMAVKDVEGVKNADMVIILMTDPKYMYRGSFTELGVALGTGKAIYIICPDEKAECRTNVFFHHPSITHLESWNQLMNIVVNTK